ncbi:MAG: hypothetical protein JXA99_00480 [Candidatus Lokiarchaeota archaeon]|nr:hypothetical protein [Candidatus Lokiarchaeota archaeon]
MTKIVISLVIFCLFLVYSLSVFIPNYQIYPLIILESIIFVYFFLRIYFSKKKKVNLLKSLRDYKINYKSILINIILPMAIYLVIQAIFAISGNEFPVGFSMSIFLMDIVVIFLFGFYFRSTLNMKSGWRESSLSHLKKIQLNNLPFFFLTKISKVTV